MNKLVFTVSKNGLVRIRIGGSYFNFETTYGDGENGVIICEKGEFERVLTRCGISLRHIGKLSTSFEVGERPIFLQGSDVENYDHFLFSKGFYNIYKLLGSSDFKEHEKALEKIYIPVLEREKGNRPDNYMFFVREEG